MLMTTTTSTPARAAMRFALAAAALMAASAAISAYWAAGGTALLDTVGGSIARWARQGGVAVQLGMALVVLVKLVAAWLPVAAVRPCRRSVRWLAWLEAAILIGYGGTLRAAGVAVQAGLVAAGHDADRKALAWHAYLWDPWFLVAGLLVFAALRAGRAARPALARLDRGNR
jgi:hypothetical protein